LTVVGASADAAEKAFSHIKQAIRANYSNPAAHGGLIVSTILKDTELTALWRSELDAMRDRINGVRRQFVQALADQGVKRDFSFLVHQKGMFSFSGLSKDQVKTLRDEHAIFIVGSGRINVAGITSGNLDRLVAAMASVL
jgi:aspartate/tyrosine/aromatic aminotransferase